MKAIRSSPRRATGAPLPRLLQGHLQRLFGTRLHDVRLVVSDAPARLRARAFAHGNMVHIGPELLREGRAAQRQVLGHEIAHVLQQRMGATRRHVAPEPPVLEHEAARAGRRVAAGRAVTLRSRTRRRPALRVQRIKLALMGTKDGDLDAATLLNIMDSALATKLATAPACANLGGTFTVTQGGHWLNLLGRLAMGVAIVPFATRRNSVLPCTLKIGDAGSAMPIYAFGGTTERIDFPAGAVAWVGGRPDKNDLNYLQIAEGFRRLNSAGHTDETIAGDLLLKMKGQDTATDYGANGNAFIEAMTALMFGVESSRFPSAYVSSLFMLDLVRTKKTYGRDGTKRFKLVTAFDSGKSFDFNCLYGGKFPCAVHEPGKGNASNRRILGELGNQANNATAYGGNFTRGQGVGMMLELNHRFIVPRREVSLMIHWLEARFGGQFLPYVRRQDIQKAIEGRIDTAASADAGPPGLMFAPLKDSGMHSNDVPGNRTKLIPHMTVYYIEYEEFDRKTKTKSFQPGKYIHTDRACKMIGGRESGKAKIMNQSYGRSADAAPKLDTLKSWILNQRDYFERAQRMACPHCCTA